MLDPDVDREELDECFDGIPPVASFVTGQVEVVVRMDESLAFPAYVRIGQTGSNNKWFFDTWDMPSLIAALDDARQWVEEQIPLRK